MKLSNKVLSLLKKDQVLRMKVALAIGIGEQGVQQNIKRNSSKLTMIAAIRVIEKETGLNEEQILAPQKATA